MRFYPHHATRSHNHCARDHYARAHTLRIGGGHTSSRSRALQTTKILHCHQSPFGWLARIVWRCSLCWRTRENRMNVLAAHTAADKVCARVRACVRSYVSENGHTTAVLRRTCCRPPTYHHSNTAQNWLKAALAQTSQIASHLCGEAVRFGLVLYFRIRRAQRRIVRCTLCESKSRRGECACNSRASPINIVSMT